VSRFARVARSAPASAIVTALALLGVQGKSVPRFPSAPRGTSGGDVQHHSLDPEGGEGVDSAEGHTRVLPPAREEVPLEPVNSGFGMRVELAEGTACGAH
jgi:hypothetical protein